MEPISPDEAHIDRTALSVGKLGDEDPDIEYSAHVSPEDRLRHMELLRRINYGRRATARLQRVLRIVKRQ